MRNSLNCTPGSHDKKEKNINMKYLTILLVLFFSGKLMAQTLPIDTTGGWYLAWHDEFNYSNAELDNNWISQNGPSGGYVLSSRWRENAVVHDGILELKAKKETRGGQDWTTGNVWTKETFGYGYFECRYEYAGATGTNNSFWLWPKNGVPAGEKAFELDINEGHYPNEVNTNIHNWTDKHPDGSHDQAPMPFTFGGMERKPGYTHIFDIPVKTNKIRFSSTDPQHFHIGEFRIYAPNASGYPVNEVSETADSDVAGLVNYTKDASTTFAASGQYIAGDGRNTDPKNVGDGQVAAVGHSWIAQDNGEKWLEITLPEEKEIGCVQFTDGWYGNNQWNGLIGTYKLQYWDGSNWVTFDEFDATNGADFSKQYHTFGFLWSQTEFKFYFDGQLFRTETNTLDHANTNILLSLAILSNNIAGEVTDAIDGTSMKVDYVRYYKDDNTTGVNDVKSGDRSVYPVKNKLFIKNSQKVNDLRIYNLQGQLVVQKSIGQSNYVNIDSLIPGVYCYVFDGDTERKTGKFIKR